MRYRYFSLIALLISSAYFANAQYADLGTGNLKNQIWWFNWAGFTFQNGATRTFSINAGLDVTVTFSNTTDEKPVPWVMNTWSGAILHLLYDFSDLTIQPAIFDVYSSNKCGYTIAVSATRNGTPVPFTLITADAEASDQFEITTLHTNGANWQTIDFFKNSEQTVLPLSGCGTNSAILNNTYGDAPETGQTPILATYSSTGNLSVDVLMDHGITTGGMAMAFGILESVDRGDLPASYGFAQHELIYQVNNSCSFIAPLPSVSVVGNLMIGSVPGDADPIQYTDDNAIGVDEEGVPSFPTYDGSGNYSVKVNVDNTTGANSFLTGWFDYNRNGTFEAQESVSTLIPDNAGSVILTWTNLPQYLPQGSATGYGFRFRISSDQNAVMAPTGFAKDGEVEDYFIVSDSLCSIKVVTTSDTSICDGQFVQLNTTGGEQYQWQPDVSLSNLNIPNPIASPQVNTTYIVTGSNSQGCSSKDTANINIRPSPVISLTPDTTICLGNPATLKAQGAMNYIWTASDGSINSTASSITVSPQKVTRYFVFSKNAEGCNILDSVTVSVHAVDFEFGPQNTEVCKNKTIELQASGGDSYNWLSEDSTILGIGPVINFSPQPGQRYFIQFTDSICSANKTQEIDITIDSLPVITVTQSNALDCSHPQTVLHATGAQKYSWQGQTNTSDPTSSDLTINPRYNTTYFVTSTGSNGCSVTDSIAVITKYDSLLSKFPIPSAFTPNHDGLNDCFRLKQWPALLNFKMEIFNRWGERLFSTTDINACWDGTLNGMAQPEGAYVYQISASTVCGFAYRKGHCNAYTLE